MKIDPYNHQIRYENWKKDGFIKSISRFNSDLLVEYLADMESGLNVSRKGVIGFARLNNLRQRMGFIVRELERLHDGKRVIDITEREIVSFFKGMRDGAIKTKKGNRYTSVADYAFVFKAFWHWYQRIENEKGSTVKDITRYIDTSPVKESEFAYFSIEELNSLAEKAKYEYRVLMWFLFDSGIRSPTELMNVKVSDLSKLDNRDIFQLNIRDEISKTFGRKIKLLLSSRHLGRYIAEKKLSHDDYLFPINPYVVNRYLKRLAARMWGDAKTKGGKFARNITLYDFRHSSACYWLPRYKSESALKYRFGWKKNEMIHHYTKLLGMRDTIVEEDLLVDNEAKTKVERELETEKKTREMLQDQLEAQRQEMAAIKEQLAHGQSRDQIILKILNGLSKQGKMKDVVGVMNEERLVGELLGEVPNGTIDHR